MLSKSADEAAIAKHETQEVVIQSTSDVGSESVESIEAQISMHNTEVEEAITPIIDVKSKEEASRENVVAAVSPALLVVENDIQIKSNENGKIVKDSKESAIVYPPTVVIHALANIENSPNSMFSNDEWASLLRFLASKEHLQKNIADVRYCSASSRTISSGRFMHAVKIEILVRTESLWETPRSYIWRNIGQDVWERSNGSSINLTRIHQK